MEWISVKDGLPKKSLSVLVYGKSIRTVALFDIDNRFYPDWGTLSHNDITHWMPLPDPPKS